ncbi:helix-turn-helix transcriptional regulator [Glaciihabitans sp. UYNi722]|uniref:helix-turn-helix domain-containing protein n=1 Tax=Glaciihabitans sp. UYNi722 TaxID=3156344 RepID=UPI00339092CC
MAKNFNELVDRAKATWSDDTRRVYEAASSEFAAEVNKRAELGAVLATARKAQSLTQPALSELTGIQQAEISRIERGAGNPTAATLLRLADALGQKLTLVPANR